MYHYTCLHLDHTWFSMTHPSYHCSINTEQTKPNWTSHQICRTTMVWFSLVFYILVFHKM